MTSNANPTPQQILATPMGPNSAEAATIRDYLVELLHELWKAGEGFSGKRPFGESGWEYELHDALAEAGLIECERDTDGEIVKVDMAAGTRLIAEAIDGLGAA